MQALAGARKGDVIPELANILEDNFLKDEQGKWFVPNPEKEADLEKLRTKRLLKQFEAYKTEAFKPKGKIKEVRVEALRAGFKEAYQEKEFKTIVQIGDRIPNNLLMEDEVLLQFYDIAVSRCRMFYQGKAVEILEKSSSRSRSYLIRFPEDDSIKQVAKF